MHKYCLEQKLNKENDLAAFIKSIIMKSSGFRFCFRKNDKYEPISFLNKHNLPTELEYCMLPS